MRLTRLKVHFPRGLIGNIRALEISQLLAVQQRECIEKMEHRSLKNLRQSQERMPMPIRAPLNSRFSALELNPTQPGTFMIKVSWDQLKST